jgi:hypothetical protein
MSGQHSTPVRGLTEKALAAGSKARFGRLFPNLKPATFGHSKKEEFDNLSRLAVAMISGFDEPKDGPDAEESGIPSLYTYFGQFVDHDLTFDPEGSFQKQKDPDAVEDFRTPAFDLDSVYGRGPGDQPYLYDGEGKRFLFGDPLTLGHAGARDLQRNGAGRALIGDPRNDENTIVSQLQGLFLRFHNRMIEEHPKFSFEEVQRLVRHHYQHIVLHDFLPRIVSSSVLDSLKIDGTYDKEKLKVFRPAPIPFMPVEFSVAAYRLGHSMVRPGYRLNDAILVPIFPNPPGAAQPFPEGLVGFRRMLSDWGIDWGRFIDIELRPYDGKGLEPFRRLQFAYRIDTALVDPLSNLPLSVAGNPPPSLALRNLLRGRQFGLPSGQAVAVALGVPPLQDTEILLGQGIDKPDAPLPNIGTLGDVFKGNCPLWAYVLAEAMHYQVSVRIPVKGDVRITTPQLGPVGGRIVAEVFLGLLFSDPGSILSHSPGGKPALGCDYALKDFVRKAIG